MKTRLLILALAIICIGADSETVVKNMPLEIKATAPLYDASKVFTLSSASNVTVFDQGIGKEAFTLCGLSLVVVGDPSPYQLTRYERPEKPEQVTATLWTKDGKKWVAKWEEVKP